MQNPLKKYSVFLLLSLCLLLDGCVGDQFAPVKERWQQPLKRPVTYRVHKGDTLYSIAWRYELDYRQIAQTNHIQPPYKLFVGQKLHLIPPSYKKSEQRRPVTPPVITTAAPQQPKSTPLSSTSKTTVTPATTATATTSPTVSTIASTPVTKVRTVKVAGINWAWPTRGKIISGFSSNGGLNKGLDISNAAGTPILAAAEGKVVYAGDGLRGYGKLIIIKHNDEFLSAYAHNQTLLVQDGQTVHTGQLIARMGSTEAKQTMLHFEIRKAGKPVDPLKYLPAR